MSGPVTDNQRILHIRGDDAGRITITIDDEVIEFRNEFGESGRLENYVVSEFTDIEIHLPEGRIE